MRVFLAGASGAIGTHLVPQLLDAGHEVVGTHASPGASRRHKREPTTKGVMR
jgi:nucleoside-diphosphate-sugar epimerase